MSKKDDKNKRIEEIRGMIADFAEEYFDKELAEFAYRLLEKIGRMRKLDITRGRPGIWAGTIVYAIARMNFLFDPGNANSLTADQVADFFDCSKSTLGNKATNLEKAANLHQGHPDYSKSEISDIFTTVQLPNGMVVTMSMFREMLAKDGLTADVEADGTITVREMEEDELSAPGIEFGVLDEEESRELERALAEKERQEKEVKAKKREAQDQKRQEKIEEKLRREDERQPNLFDWSGES